MLTGDERKKLAQVLQVMEHEWSQWPEWADDRERQMTVPSCSRCCGTIHTGHDADCEYDTALKTLRELVEDPS